MLRHPLRRKNCLSTSCWRLQGCSEEVSWCSSPVLTLFPIYSTLAELTFCITHCGSCIFAKIRLKPREGKEPSYCFNVLWSGQLVHF